MKYLLILCIVSCFALEKGDKIYVAGHRGMVGSAIIRRLRQDGHDNIVTRTSGELDLRCQEAVHAFFEEEKPDYVFLAAAKVGGIHANNTYPAQFIRDNLQIEINIIDAAHRSGIKKLLFLGSSCIYPRMCPQPMREEHLLTGPLEPTNEWYALAKIAGIKLCQAYNKEFGTNFISCMPTNLYGPGDNFHPANSHVLPALIRRFDHAAQTGASQVVLWGTGKAQREFLHVDDLADACVFLMENYSGNANINIGWGKDLSIKELAELIAEKTGFSGKLVYDSSKPDGTPRKLLDTTMINDLGWKPRIELRQGLKDTIAWYRKHKASVRQ